jgi:hypothetical protein
MRHIHHTGARRIMPSHHIIPFVVIHSWITVHQFSKHISAHVREIRAEQPTNIGFKPVQTWQKLMNVVFLVPLKEVAIVQQREDVGGLMLDVGNRTKSEVFIDQTFDYWVVFGEGDVHLNGALRVADVIYFLLGLVGNVTKRSWDIIVRHVLKCKCPKFGILLRVVFSMI